MVSKYSSEQLAAYEEHIDLPFRFRRCQLPSLTVEYLTALHIHQITAVPYENLLLHYSTKYSISLDAQTLFRKIVTDKRGRGGYCMENSIFFNHILKGLGFKVYTAGVRIRPRIGGVPGGDYIGWVHITNIVSLPDGLKYSVDVAFGGDGATLPLPLVEGIVHTNLGNQQIRLIHDNIPPQTSNLSTKYWVYQYRNGVDKQWNSFYAFSEEFEFFPSDFEVMNWYTSTSKGETNFQTRTVLIVRFLREGESIVGKLMLVNGEVKRNMGGKTETVVMCRTEAERVKVLENIFSITLTAAEKAGIRGRNVDLDA